MSYPTGSGLEKALACPASMVLDTRVSEGGEYAERGSEIGAFLRAVIGGTPRETALAAVTDQAWRETCAGIDVGALVSGLRLVRGECAYAVDVEAEKARFLGTNIGRSYPELFPCEIAATNDLEGQGFRDRWVVRDFKSGWREVTPAERNPQVLFESLCLYLFHGGTEVDGGIVYVSEDGSTRTDNAIFTAYQLDGFLEDLRALPSRVERARQAIESGRIEVNAGPWCTYCPSKVVCPRYTGLARAVLGEVTDTQARLALLSPEQLGEAWEKVTLAGEIVDKVREGIKELARAAPIPLPSGKMLTEGRSSSSTFDRARALELLREKGVAEEVIVSLTKKKATYPVTERNPPKQLKGKKK